MSDKEIYALLKSERGTITELKKRSKLSFLSIRRIMLNGEWQNLKLKKFAIEILEEIKIRKEEEKNISEDLKNRANSLALFFAHIVVNLTTI